MAGPVLRGLVDAAKGAALFGVFGPAFGALLVLPFALFPTIAAVFREASLAPLVEGLAAFFFVGVASVFVGLVPGVLTGVLVGPLRPLLGGGRGMAIAAGVGALLTFGWLTLMPMMKLSPWTFAGVGAVAAAIISLSAGPEGLGQSP